MAKSARSCQATVLPKCRPSLHGLGIRSTNPLGCSPKRSFTPRSRRGLRSGSRTSASRGTLVPHSRPSLNHPESHWAIGYDLRAIGFKNFPTRPQGPLASAQFLECARQHPHCQSGVFRFSRYRWISTVIAQIGVCCGPSRRQPPHHFAWLPPGSGVPESTNVAFLPAS